MDEEIRNSLPSTDSRGFLPEFCLCTEFTLFFSGHLGCMHFPKIPQRQKSVWIQTLVSWSAAAAVSQLGRLSALIDSWRVLPRCRIDESGFENGFGKTHEIWCTLEHVGAIVLPVLPVLPLVTLVFDCFSQSCHDQLFKWLVLCNFCLRPISDLNQSQMALALRCGLLWRILELHLPCTIFFGWRVDPRDSLQWRVAVHRRCSEDEVRSRHCSVALSVSGAAAEDRKMGFGVASTTAPFHSFTSGGQTTELFGCHTHGPESLS